MDLSWGFPRVVCGFGGLTHIGCTWVSHFFYSAGPWVTHGSVYNASVPNGASMRLQKNDNSSCNTPHKSPLNPNTSS